MCKKIINFYFYFMMCTSGTGFLTKKYVKINFCCQKTLFFTTKKKLFFRKLHDFNHFFFFFWGGGAKKNLKYETGLHEPKHFWTAYRITDPTNSIFYSNLWSRSERHLCACLAQSCTEHKKKAIWYVFWIAGVFMFSFHGVL